MPPLVIVAAVASNGVIGRDNGLIWRLKTDMRHFRAQTLGKPVLMGRKTFDSIGKPLPGRQNWVLTRDPHWQVPGVECFGNWEQVVRQHRSGLLWVIGGGEIYLAALADVDRIESTEVDTRIAAADTWFPPLPDKQWDIVARELHAADERHAFGFDLVTRTRRRS